MLGYFPALIFAIFSVAAEPAPQSVYLYEITTAKPAEADTQASQRVAHYLEGQGLTATCIDLQQTDAGTRLLVRAALDSAKQEGLKKAVCGTQLSCTATIKMREAATTVLAFEVTHEPIPGYPQAAQSEASVRNYRLTDAAEAVRIPTLSPSCRTGDDPKAFAADTPEARSYLKAQGVDLRTARSFRLRSLDRSLDWKFAPPARESRLPASDRD